MKTLKILKIIVIRSHSKKIFIRLNKKAIKLGKIGGTPKRSRLRNNNITTQQGVCDEGNYRTAKLSDFPRKNWAMISHEVKQWLINLKKLAASGESIIVKYCGHYLGKSRKYNKQSRTTNKSDDEGNDDASTSKDDQK